MSKKRKSDEPESFDGTVEGLALEFFEREKAAYEERTGETVEYVPPTPVTRTPIAAEVTSDEGDDSPESKPTEGEMK